MSRRYNSNNKGKGSSKNNDAAASPPESVVRQVYVRSTDHGWIPALQLKVHDGKARVAVPKFANGGEKEMMQCPSHHRSGSTAVDPKLYKDNQVVDLSDYPHGVLPLQNVNVHNGHLEEYKDMVQLPYMHEAAILYNLKLRHVRSKPYTRTGDIVIAVNPYQWFHDLYTTEKQNLYANRLVYNGPTATSGKRSNNESDNNEDAAVDARDLLEPHVYEVSALAYQGLCFGEERDQSILVSGESGAGKTETVKICLQHIAAVQRQRTAGGSSSAIRADQQNAVVRRVVESNPLLEAFGNAKTRRNDNSSRFGKYLQLEFKNNNGNNKTAGYCTLVGSKCEVYLLEKNRVVHHEPDERTFHIFYQLLAAPDAVKGRYWPKLRGASAASFNYVGHTSTNTIEGVTDAKRFEQTVAALELVGVKGLKLESLMQALCIVLQLGQIGFKESSGGSTESEAGAAAVSTKGALNDLASLMGISASSLSSALTERTFSTKHESHKVPLSVAQAADGCHALAKEAYQKAFLWLVACINDATRARPDNSSTYANQNYTKLHTIGLLDIFGFEAFPVNRFEQLCINYANEKLQQKFNQDVFVKVQEEYRAQGLPLDEVKYDDNTDVLDVIEGTPSGLLALLNEECIRPNGNDTAFVQKALQRNKNVNKSLLVHRTDQLSFGIHHYAGVVWYDAEYFVVRNADTLPTDLQSAAEECTNVIVRQPRSEPVAASGGNNSTVQNSKRFFAMRGRPPRSESNLVAPTVWTKYKNQLSSLMVTLRNTKSRYIRCIKPNSSKKPGLLEHSATIEQLRSAGVVAGITIARSVFPNRLDNAVVLARYANLWDDKRRFPSSKNASRMSPQEQRAADCKAVLACALQKYKGNSKGKDGKNDKEPFCVGKTRTYFRAGALEWLELHRTSGLDGQAVVVQKYVRGWLVRRQTGNRMRNAAEAAARKRQEEARYKAEQARLRAARQVARDEEKQALLDRVRQLEKEMAAADRDANYAAEDCRERLRAAERARDLLREKQAGNENDALDHARALAFQHKKLEDAKKLIDYLRRENTKHRKGAEKLKEKWDAVHENTVSLLEGNESLGNIFDDENGQTAVYGRRCDQLRENLAVAKEANKDLKNKVQRMQDTYMCTAEGRLDLQKCMARILTMIQDRCKQRQLVEDTICIALDCERGAKAEMAALSVFETADHHGSEPSLCASDVSETDASDHHL